MMPVIATGATHADGVTYLSAPELPGQEMFRCGSWHATMTVASCAKRWRRQRNAIVPDRDACYGCIIGAAHAGEKPDRRSRIFHWPLCPRCRRRCERMIGRRVCISCYNRQREFFSGRNAKGGRPRLVLEPVRIGVIVDPGGVGERYIEIAEPAVRDTIELAVGALRVVDGAVAITRPRGDVPPMTISELTRMFATKQRRKSGVELLAADIVRRYGRNLRAQRAI